MKNARKVIITESIVYELGKEFQDKGIIDHIKITYPLVKVFVKGNAIPVANTFLQASSVIEWLADD